MEDETLRGGMKFLINKGSRLLASLNAALPTASLQPGSD